MDSLSHIYVDNLPASLTSKGLWALFALFGDVTSASIIVARETGYSRQLGYVRMRSLAQAQRAVRDLHKSVLDGRTLYVRLGASLELSRRRSASHKSFRRGRKFQESAHEDWGFDPEQARLIERETDREEWEDGVGVDERENDPLYNGWSIEEEEDERY